MSEAENSTLQPDAGRTVVCHVSTVHPALDKRIFYRECVGLVEGGFEVHEVACHDRDEVVQGVHIHALPKPPNRLARLLWWPWLAYRKVLSLRPRPDIVHFHDPELMPVGQALRMRGMQAVFDVHENVAGTFESKHWLPVFVRWPLARAYEVAERFLTSGIAVVTVLDSMAQGYRHPRAVVRNLPRLGLGPAPTPIDFKPPWRLVYTGYVTPERGGIRMLQLLEDLRERGVPASLRIVGLIWPEWWQKQVFEYIEAHNLKDLVTVTGEVSQVESLAEISKAHVGLCLLDATPNYTNSLPVKMCEYMRYSLPVVASDFACWNEFVSDIHAGVQVDINNRKGIADAVERMLSDPAEMARMGERGWQAVKEEYCWEKEQERLWRFYQQLLQRRGHVAECAEVACSGSGR